MKKVYLIPLLLVAILNGNRDKGLLGILSPSSYSLNPLLKHNHSPRDDMTVFLALPKELLCEIGKHLSPKDYVSLMSVLKRPKLSDHMMGHRFPKGQPRGGLLRFIEAIEEEPDILNKHKNKVRQYYKKWYPDDDIDDQIRGLDEITEVCRQNQREKFERLLINRIEINWFDKYGSTPLQIACAFGRLSFVQELLELGVCINKSSRILKGGGKGWEKGDTPLCAATRHSYLDIMRLLIAKKADLNKEGYLSDSPLHIAAQNGSLESLNVLLAAGALVNKENESEYISIPLQVALHNSYRKEHAPHTQHEEVALRLIEVGSNINARSMSGFTMVHEAILSNLEVVLEELIKQGADVDAANERGTSPLLEAVIRNKEEMVSRLIQAGANVNISDEDGLTLLSQAECLKNERIVALLKKAGAE